MGLRRGSGLFIFIALCVAGVAYALASRLGYTQRFTRTYVPGLQTGVHLSAGDFPAGVTAPVGDWASVPLRPTMIGFTPRGSSVGLLIAAGGAVQPESARAENPQGGLLQTGYALDSRAVVFRREEDLRRAFALGGDRGGVDMAAVSVDRLALWFASLRDAAPRTLMLLGRSRGQEALAALGIEDLAGLRGKRLAAYSHGSSYYFGLWLLSRAGLSVQDVKWVELNSNLDSGRALREGKAEAALGLFGDVDLAAKDRGGRVLATTADAPHLLATVLVTRGDFAARYPDAVRRVLRGLIDSEAALRRDPSAGARLLGEVAPYLGDPIEAIESAPPADLKDNLAFFGVAGEAPVTYDELFQSAAALFHKMGKAPKPPPSEDTRDMNALKYVAQTRESGTILK